MLHLDEDYARPHEGRDPPEGPGEGFLRAARELAALDVARGTLAAGVTEDP